MLFGLRFVISEAISNVGELGARFRGVLGNRKVFVLVDILLGIDTFRGCGIFKVCEIEPRELSGPDPIAPLFLRPELEFGRESERESASLLKKFESLLRKDGDGGILCKVSTVLSDRDGRLDLERL